MQTQQKEKEKKEEKEERRKKRKKERIHDSLTRIFVRLLRKFKVNSMLIMYKKSLLLVLYLLKNFNY